MHPPTHASRALLRLGVACLLCLPIAGHAGDLCRSATFQGKVVATARTAGVNASELLSILATESACHPYAVAWIHRKTKVMDHRYADSAAEAKALALQLIGTGLYRVDVGIGQINYEANIKKKGWSLDAILHPDTALHYVARMLQERSWRYYHSSTPSLAHRWQQRAVKAFNRITGSSVTVSSAVRTPAPRRQQPLHQKFEISFRTPPPAAARHN